ncbi:MAG: hypothetical protein AB7N76_35040 [Planctomycetota bacterium]
MGTESSATREVENREPWLIRLDELARRFNRFATTLASAVPNEEAKERLPPEERRKTATCVRMVGVIEDALAELRLYALDIPPQAADLRKMIETAASDEQVKQPTQRDTVRALRYLAEVVWRIARQHLPERGLGFSPGLDTTHRRPKRGTVGEIVLRELEYRRPQYVSQAALEGQVKASGFKPASVRPAVASLRRSGWPIEHAPRGSEHQGWRLRSTDPTSHDT